MASLSCMARRWLGNILVQQLELAAADLAIPRRLSSGVI